MQSWDRATWAGSFAGLAHLVQQQRVVGLTYEIVDSMQCIRNGRYQSDVVPQADTLECARMFDMIGATKP